MPKGWKLKKNEPTWMIWENIHSGIEIWVGKERMENIKSGKQEIVWNVYRNSTTDSGSKGTFYTKAKALAYAKSYMKKH